MAFQNVVMPKIKLVHGVTKQIIDPVTVIGNGNRETRRKQSRYERFVWKFPSRSILKESKVELYEFFKSTNSSLDSFLMTDPDFPEFYETPLVHKTGSVWYLELPGGHPVFNPVMGGLSFYKNGVLAAATFAVDADGRPTVTITGTSGVDNVHVNGPVHLTVRLNSALGWSISAMDKSPSGATCTPTPTIVDMADIEIIEVFERA